MSIYVGGVGELFQSDLDLGRLAVDQLRPGLAGPGVWVEELHYGAVAVTQRLAEVRPDALVLVGAVRRGGTPGTVQRRRLDPPDLPAATLQAAVGDAVTGYVHVDLVVEVAAGFGALPPRVVVVEVEPAVVGPGEGLSPLAQTGLEQAVALVTTEVERTPLLELAEDLRLLVAGDRLEPSPALSALRALLDELVVVDRDGRWGRTFALRDRFRRSIAEGASSEGMDHRDWGLWWALIEEVDRLQARETAAAG